MDAKFKILLGVFILLLCVWLGLSVYNKYRKNSVVIPPPINHPPAGQLPQSAAKSEEERIKSLAENFLSIYGSYQLGNFDGLRNAQIMTTEKYKEEIDRFITVKEAESKNKPKQYITFTSVPQEVVIVSLKSGEAKVSVDFDFFTMFGAYLYLDGVLTQVDESGKKSDVPPKKEQTRKKADLLIVKENNAWKVDSIKIE